MGFIINIHTGLNVMKALRRSTPNGWEKNQPFQLSFNASLKIDFQGSRITSDGGVILVRASLPVLLADAGREPSHTAVVWEHGSTDRGARCGDWVAGGR